MKSVYIKKSNGRKKIKINSITILENTKKQQEYNGGYQYSAYTPDQMEQPAGMRYSDMDFDTLSEAIDWARSYDTYD